MQKIKVKEMSRIDKYISDNTEITRNAIKELILDKKIMVNDVIVNKPKYIVKVDDEINILEQPPVKEMKFEAENIPLNIVYEDDNLIVIDKPSNMVVHPSPGNMTKTLVNSLLYHFGKNLSDENGYLRPGIVHRIDKNTSGLLVVAKNNKTHQHLAQQLKDHKVKRKYKAIVHGHLENEITHVNLPIGRDVKNRQKMGVTKHNSKEALTHIYLEDRFFKDKKPYSLIRCELETGRTHQIRVHLSYIKHPVVGDDLYGRKIDDLGQRLHAYELEFEDINGKTMKFNSELPIEMKEFLNN